ncbi:MAG: SPOR domain-containing protein [Bacteroidetes bacterium]|nr:SPOR domain-containing protein [Bacteroidota bacterium]
MSAESFTLVSFVEKLVRLHECVVVPGLGGFITRDHSAALNRFNGQLKPRSRTIFFNDILRQDDGILMNHIMSETGMDKGNAEQFVQREVQSLLQRCAGHEQQSFGSLGSFYLNQHDKLFFLPSVTLNLADIAYGLKPVQLEAVVETLTQEIRKPLSPKAVSEPEAVIVEPISVATETSIPASRPRIWKVAAAVAILSLSTAAGIRISNYLRQDSSALLTASTMGSETIQEEISRESSKAKINMAHATPVTKAQPAVAGKSASAKNNGDYKVIAACFITEKAAIEELKRLADKGISAYTGRPSQSALYRIMVGEAATPQEAATLATTFTRNTKIRARVEQLRLP